MESNIESLLHKLGEAICAENALAERRIANVEASHQALAARHERMIEKFRAFVAELEKPANDLGSDDLASKNGIEPSEKNLNSRQKIADTDLIDALTSDWISAGTLRKLLISRGVKLAEGTVYNRMRKLVAERPNEIETTTRPERWRLRTAPEGGLPKMRAGKRRVKKEAVVLSAKPALSLVESACPDATPSVGSLRPHLRHGDCLELMKSIPEGSVDLILADLPYGTTRLKIDQRLSLDELWTEYRRIIKPTGNIVLFGSQPFSSLLVSSAPDLFRYAMVWEKNKPTGHQHANDKPLKWHEDILVFSPGVNISAKRSARRATYNPQGAIQVVRKGRGLTKVNYLGNAVRGSEEGEEFLGITNCPKDILTFPKDCVGKGEKAHPFTKPVPLLEYLIRTFSNPGEVVLDNTMGSGSTCIAAMNTGRRSIGIELDKEWFEFAAARVEQAFQATNVEVAIKPIIPISKSCQSEIYQGDCLKVMKQMPSRSVDLIVTSPPYNLGLKRRGGMKNTLWPNAKLADGYRSYDDAMPQGDYVEWLGDVLNEGWRLLADDGAIFMNHKPRIQKGKLWTPLDLKHDLPVRQIVVWDRGSGMNFNRSFFTPSCEWIVIYAKPNFRFADGKLPRDVWQIPPERQNDHPAPFPVELPLKAIEHTSAKVVLDPFVGSGTTGVAALRCGRKFIGIELDEQYAANAVARIDAESRLKDAA